MSGAPAAFVQVNMVCAEGFEPPTLRLARARRTNMSGRRTWRTVRPSAVALDGSACKANRSQGLPGAGGLRIGDGSM